MTSSSPEAALSSSSPFPKERGSYSTRPLPIIFHPPTPFSNVALQQLRVRYRGVLIFFLSLLPPAHDDEDVSIASSASANTLFTTMRRGGVVYLFPGVVESRQTHPHIIGKYDRLLLCWYPFCFNNPLFYLCSTRVLQEEAWVPVSLLILVTSPVSPTFPK